MTFDPEEILAVIDRNNEVFSFPMLDNGYIYLAATRLSLYRSKSDWAIVIEVFGFNPRAGLPTTTIQTFASRLHDRDSPDNYVSREAYERYISNNPNNEFRSVYPINDGPWMDAENYEFVAEDAREILVRNLSIPLPAVSEYIRYGIELENFPQVKVFELCRFLAATSRDQVLATPTERRISIVPEMEQLLQLEEWHHPDVVQKEVHPSGSETFQQLAKVLATGDVDLYKPSQPPNTHWKHWPEGGRL